MLKHICVSASGSIRTHGPRSSRCPGSNSATHVSTTISQGAQPPTSVEAHGSSSPPPFCLPQTRVSIVRRLPKGSYRLAFEKLCSLLEDMVATNFLSSWEKLLSFAPSCLYSPRRSGKCSSLASQMNRQLDSDEGPPEPLRTRQSRRHSPMSEDCLRAAVSIKMEEVDLRGAIRFASSNSSIVGPTEDIFHTLLDKHPPPPSDYSL